jgi:predicted P-loop ATPase
MTGAEPKDPFNTIDFKKGQNAPRPAKGGLDWLGKAATDSKGAPLPTLSNVLLCLRGAPELAGCFGFNEMMAEVQLIEELPCVEGGNSASVGSLPRSVIDADILQVVEWMQRQCRLKKISVDMLHHAIDRRGREHRFHPLRDWLKDLRWDQKPRAERIFPVYFGSPDTPYERAAGKMFLIEMVARAFDPGCQADYVPILVGPQGKMKSKALAILAGREYFGDQLPDVHHKDASQYLRGKWLIELPELAALNKGDVETWKAFITRQVEKYRPPWGRRDIVEPRQCVFAGSTNEDEFLRDTTGNRRWWPIATPRINVGELEFDREMIWAEAVVLFRKGERSWPDEEMQERFFAPQQERRVVTDPWTEKIEGWLEGRRKTTTAEILTDALGLIIGQTNSHHGRRVAVVMDKLKWGKKRKGGGGPRYYVRDPSDIWGSLDDDE